MEDILAVSIPIVGFICLVVIIRMLGEQRLKHRLIEMHASAELVKALTDAELRLREHNALKWGLLLLLLSLAFLLIELCNLTAGDPAAFGLLLGATGLALLCVHFQRKKS